MASSAALVGCGAGTDTVAGSYLRGVRVDGCERVAVGGQVEGLLRAASTPVRHGRLLRLPLSCNLPGATGLACVGQLDARLVRPGGGLRRLGTAPLRLRSRHHATLTVRLTPAGLRALTAAGPHPVLQLTLATVGLSHPPRPYASLAPALGAWQVAL
jgi:hypothetical protein